MSQSIRVVRGRRDTLRLELQSSAGRGRTRDDSGNLVAVVVLVVALALMVTITVAAVVPTFTVASSSQYGEQAVEQANSGLSDALLQLDQMGDQVSSFCVGSAPSSLMSKAGLTSCSNQSSSTPVASAPGVVYYLAYAIRSTLTFSVTNEVQLTSEAIVSGQKRTATELVYREADQFGLFTVGTMTTNGNTGGASIGAAGGDPLVVTPNGTVDVGAGPKATMTCNGGSSPNLIFIGEKGTIDNCSTSSDQNTTLTPADPSFCSTNQVSTAFKPCINTGGSALDSCPNCQTTSTGSTYCPLPGTGFTAATVTSVPTPPANAVFDCTSAGGEVTIGDYASQGNCNNDTVPTVTMTDGFTTLPAGNYYLDSNQVIICGFPPDKLPVGPVNIFILPAACSSGSTSGQCQFELPTQQGYTCPWASSTASLNLEGPYINSEQTTNTSSGISYGPKGNPTYVDAGEPNDFNIYWGGDKNIGTSNGPSKNVVFDSNLYAPGAGYKTNGSTGGIVIGSLVSNCFTDNGGPNLDFTYGEHGTTYLQGWTATEYSITP